jgi:hypothetical protein
MHSAFKKGVELLIEESPWKSHSAEMVENSRKSAESISGVPRNVTQLKPVINELMRKVIMIAI